MRKVTLSAALKSGKGNVRTNNEDAYYFNGRFTDISVMDQETSLYNACLDDTALFAICDGMGGHENGELASYTAVSRMAELQQALNSTDFSTATIQWVEETNEAINKATNDGGCTLALLFLCSEMVHIAHMGDSRVYRYHQDKLIRMTRDHSKLQVLLDAGIITEKEAKTYPQRHVITRALGMNGEDNGKCLPTIQNPVAAEDHDRYIICCDGVTDMLSDEQIERLLACSKTVEECTDAIYQAALEAGGKDNTTVIVIELQCDSKDLNDHKDKEDPYESTWTPEEETSPICIEQLTTIRQANGRNFTIKTYIGGSQINELYPLN